MRGLALVLPVVVGCGGGGAHGHGPPPPAAVQEAPGFTATRWLPANPTYAISSHALSDAQRAIRDITGALGFLARMSESKVSHDFEQLLGVDALSVEALRAIGIDPEGGFSLFSDDIDPTFAVHVASPDALAAFFDKLHGRGMVSQSVIVDGTEIFTANAGGGVSISWIVKGDWLLTHVAIPGTHDDGRSWVTASTKRTSSNWFESWQWANRVAEHIAKSPRVLGFVDLQKLVAMSQRGADSYACAQAFAAVKRVGFAFDTDGVKSADARITFELGDAASSVASAVLAAPPGWSAASANAPFALQWNVDVERIAAWFSPCAGAMDAGRDLQDIRKTGIRSARVFVQSLDVGNMSGAGAASMDLSSTKLVTDMLDKIPLRSAVERDRTWHGVAGHHIGIPMGPSVDYVLDPTHVIAALGDGLMDAVLAPAAKSSPPALFQLDITPSGLSKQLWEMVLDRIGGARYLLSTLDAWHDGHLSLTLEGSAVVLEAHGNRR